MIAIQNTALTVEVSLMEKILYIAVTGESTPRDGQYLHNYLKEQMSNPVPEGFLIDVSGLNGRLTIKDYMIQAEDVPAFLQNKKTALVEHSVNTEQGRIQETVYRNRGSNFRVFFDKDEALRWLKNSLI